MDSVTVRNTSAAGLSGVALELCVLLSKIWECSQGLLCRKRNVSDRLVPSSVAAASDTNKLLHAVKSHLDHLARPGKVQSAVRTIQ